MQHPLRSLREGHWFKLICGASFQHLPAVRNLSVAYALAGADCIDVAADPAVIAAAQSALKTATEIAQADPAAWPHFQGQPWLMVSLNDGEDPHFRKAEFDPTCCPPTCSRPCEPICPAQAIAFDPTEHGFSGVLDQLCYGCGRCLPICPEQHITTRSYVSTPSAIAPLVLTGVDAVEIHTQVGRLEDFQRLWQAILPWVAHLKLVAVSCPDGEGLIDYLWALHDLMAPLPVALLWQTDGRPMSGDIGAGTTHAAVRLGQKVLSAGLPGYVQLAGGTNHYTVKKLRSRQLLLPEAQGSFISGIAYGSYARRLLIEVLQQLEDQSCDPSRVEPSALQNQALNLSHSGGEISSISKTPFYPTVLEATPDLLQRAVDLARSLVAQLKTPADVGNAVLAQSVVQPSIGSTSAPTSSLENSVYS